MPYYKDNSNNIYWYDTEQEKERFAKVPMSIVDEATALSIAQPPPTQAELDAWQRITDIKTAQENAGIKELTVDQATTYITNLLDTTALDATGVDIDNATDLTTAKAAFKSSIIELRKLVINEREILLKMIPYLLQG